MNRRAERARDFGAALLRLGLGAYFLMHAYFVLANYGIQGLAQANAARWGVPLPELAAWYVVLGHAVGGSMLVVGLYPRIGALLNVPIMAGAVLFVHLNQGFFMRGVVVSAAEGRAIAGGYEYSLFLLLATVAAAFLGGGMFSLSGARRKNRLRLS